MATERAFLDYPGLATFKGEMDIEFAKKVDKVEGKGLSKNDYTDSDKSKVQTALQQHQDISGKLDVSLKGVANGLAELGSDGKVPSSQLPSYVDDVLEYDSRNAFPSTGESGKIYIAKNTNITYRWTGSTYAEVGQSLALGETSATAYRGDRGKIAYDHATAKGASFVSGLYKIATNSEGHVTAATDVVKQDIVDLGIPGEMPVVPQKVSDLPNDAGYLTEHQDISGKVDKVNGKQLSTNDYTDEDKASLAAAIADISGKIDELEKGVANGVATLGADGKVPANQLPAGHTTISKIIMNNEEAPMDSSGVVNLGGVATLNAQGKVPESQLPIIPSGVEVRVENETLFITTNEGA